MFIGFFVLYKRLKVEKSTLLRIYLSEFVARACTWTLCSQLLVHLMKTHFETSAAQLYLVGASISVLFLSTIIGGLIRDFILRERQLIMIGILLIVFASLFLLVMPSSLYLGLGMTFIGAGFITSATPILLNNNANNDQHKLFTILYAFTNGGVILGSIIGGILNSTLSWGYLIIFNFVISAICFILFFFGNEKWGPALITITRSSSLKLTGFLIPTIFLIAIYLRSETFSQVILGAITIYYIFTLIYWMISRRSIRKNLIIGMYFILLAILFFTGEFQVASTTIAYAIKFANLDIFGVAIPPGSIVALESIFVVLGAYAITRIKFEFDTTKRIVIGLLFGVLAFATLLASTFVAGSVKISLMWLILAFLFFGVGDVYLTPPIMSYITKISPDDIRGRLISGMYFSFSLAGYLSGLIGSKISVHFSDASNNLKFYYYDFFLMLGILVLAIASMLLMRLIKYRDS